MTKNTQTKEKIQLDVALVTPVFLLANKPQTVCLRIGLTGFQRQTIKEPLVPLNMALVINTSSSMLGEKIHQVKEAAMRLVKRLRPADLIAIITYNHQSEVLLPATDAQDQKTITSVIQTLGADEQIGLFDGTALFNGIEKGVQEILKCRQRYRINRMILLSDGLASMDFNSLIEMSELGRVLGAKNITITTIGFGADHNQELMMPLSQQTDGHHAVVENMTDITRIFDLEWTHLASVVAQEIKVTVTCSENVRPLKVLDRKAKIEGQTVSIQLNQLDSQREECVFLELEISLVLNQPQQTLEQTLAEVLITYRNLKTHRHQRLKKFINCVCMLMVNESLTRYDE